MGLERIGFENQVPFGKIQWIVGAAGGVAGGTVSVHPF
jgi:hypothetical protein